jgi:hypothetical protein
MHIWRIKIGNVLVLHRIKDTVMRFEGSVPGSVELCKLRKERHQGVGDMGDHHKH